MENKFSKYFTPTKIILLLYYDVMAPIFYELSSHILESTATVQWIRNGPSQKSHICGKLMYVRKRKPEAELYPGPIRTLYHVGRFCTFKLSE